MNVLDFSQFIAGPSAAAAFGDMGADVIKIERIDGEANRYISGSRDVPPSFVANNRGKRSLAIDLSNSAGVEIVKRLVVHCDVLVEGFRPGVMDRLGLGYQAMHDVNPRLVYASVSGFAVDGAFGLMPATDPVIQAESGMMSITGEDPGPPLRVGFQVVDAATGLALGQAILAALLQRERTGAGSRVSVSLYEVAAYLQAPEFVAASSAGTLPRYGNRPYQIGVPNDVYPTSDGGAVIVSAYRPAQWNALCEALELPELATDARFANGPLRVKNREQLTAILRAAFGRRSRDEWTAKMSQAGVLAAPVRDHAEILRDASLRSAGRFRWVAATEAGGYWLPQLPVQSQDDGCVRSCLPPKLGEHTHDILFGIGYPSAQIARLEASGVIRGQPDPAGRAGAEA